MLTLFYRLVLPLPTQAQLRAALDAEDAARHAAEAAVAAAAPQPGPHLEASTSYLTMACHAGGKAATASLTLTHRGTAAVRYHWQRQPRRQLPHAPSDASQPHFFLPQQSGVLLPGQVAELTVSFRAPLPGTYSEAWRLVTVPPLLPLLGPPVVLELRGYAEQRDESAVGRASLEAALAEKEKMAKVQVRGGGGG